MNLTLDIGNTAAKFAVFDGNSMIFNVSTDADADRLKLLVKSIEARFAIENCIISTVSLPFEDAAKALEGVRGGKYENIIELDHATKIPIKNLYKTPHTLGNDRLAAAVGAAALFPGANCLVIDAGTAITYDYVRDGSEFAGGNISPGIPMRLKALHDYTSRLPLVEPVDTDDYFGRSTKEAISNGVVHGVLHEIQGYADDFEKKNVNSKIILTGGGSIFLCKKLKNTIFAEPNLVSIGLNRILNYNVLKNT